MRKIKQILALVSVLLLLGGVGYTMASDSSVGSLNVTSEIGRISEVQFPSAVDPNAFTTLAFQLEYETGFTTDCDVWVHFFSSGIIPDLPVGGQTPTTLNDESHLSAHWQNDGNGWDVLGGAFSGFVSPAVIVSDGSPIALGLDVKFIKEVMVGDWELRILLKYYSISEDITKYIWDTTLFTMNGFMEVAINFATFDFGDIEQGQVEIPISTPLCGYLNLTVTSNIAYAIQVSGTSPDDGEENSFDVSNILANSVNDVGSAVALSLLLADLANLDPQVAGSEVIHRIYLWISIPVGAPVGTYTFVLTIAVVPA